MFYVLTLNFNQDTKEKIANFRKKTEYNFEPHITIGAFNDIDVDKAMKLTKDYCQNLKKFKIQLSNVGIFTWPKPVAWIGPVVTEELINLHKDLHKTLDFCDTKGLEYYLPNNWVPHCTVDSLEDTVEASALYLMKNFKQFAAEIVALEWISIEMENSDLKIKTLKTFELQ
ncbi:MAG: 2'-5' RNA ligase family protein [Defluviitaleaceae bacterium]|nr:2'-5' RNA ligase family protein [Defluviitaleaceae bacterium]